MKLRKAINMIVATTAIVGTTYTHDLFAQTATGATADQKTNFLIILLDDMGYANLGAFGAEIPTPNIDKLADEGIVFTNFHSAPSSTPARAMLFTGKDSHVAGAGTMDGWVRPEQSGPDGKPLPAYQVRLSKEVLPISELLLNNGYDTILSGKWDLGLEEGYHPKDRGFSQNFALLTGGDNFFMSDSDGNPITSYVAVFEKMGWPSPYDENGQLLATLPPNGYTTDVFTDKAIAMLDKRDKGKPFFLAVTYNAPHDPFQAPADVTAKHISAYSKGWDVVRQERFDRQKQLGFWPKDLKLPPRPDHVPAWDSLTHNEQLVEAKRMAVYAAQVDIADQNVGRLVEHLKQTGDYDNTVIFVLSDNGGPSHAPANGELPARKFCGDAVAKLDAATRKLVDNFANCDNSLDNMGSNHSFISSSPGWGMVMNLPYNYYKSDTYEGGVRVPAIAHYAKSKVKGVKTNCLSHIMDITPTVLEMAQIPYPLTFQDKANPPLEGVSMANLFAGNLYCDADRWIGWELDSAKGVLKGNWKLSQWKDTFNSRVNGTWSLFNLTKDPFEYNDRALTNPRELEELSKIYEEYAKLNNVVDIGPYQIVGNMGAAVNGKPATTTRIAGGASVKTILGFSMFRRDVTNTTTVPVEIAASISPGPDYEGKPADIFVKVDYHPAGGGPVVSWALTPTEKMLVEWPATQAEPPVFFMNSTALPARLPLEIYKPGLLTVAGKLEISVGFQLRDGTKVQSEHPITIEIAAPTPAPATPASAPATPTPATATGK
jgi:arylsulfatase